MHKILIILFLLFSSSVLAKNDLMGSKFLCSKLLWGFEFTSFNKVKVISTDINKNTKIKDFFYYIDNKLPFINIYFIENNSKNIIYSIHLKTLRVDIRTMTSGGNTTREMIPAGFCEKVEIDDIKNHIEVLKN